MSNLLAEKPYEGAVLKQAIEGDDIACFATSVIDSIWLTWRIGNNLTHPVEEIMINAVHSQQVERRWGGRSLGPR